MEIDSGRRKRETPPRVTFANWSRLWKASEYFKHITIPENMDEFVQDIQDGFVMGCRDGSFKPDLSVETLASAWQLQIIRTSNAAQGVNQKPVM